MLYMLKKGFQYFHIKLFVLYCIMVLSIWLALFMFPFVQAQWPPDCARDGPFVRLTNLQESSGRCKVTQNFNNVAYIQLHRQYGRQPAEGTDSLVTLHIKSKSPFQINIHNDYIELNDKRCDFPLANRDEAPFWLRLRLHSLIDLQKTFVSLAISLDGDQQFSNCLKTEMNGLIRDFQVHFSASTKSGMRQILRRLTSQKPVSNDIDRARLLESRVESIEERLRNMERFEERFRRMQNTLSEYTHAHDTFKSTSEERHVQLQDSLGVVHDRIVHRTNAHGIVYLFGFVILIIMGFAYIRWKNIREKRLHLF